MKPTKEQLTGAAVTLAVHALVVLLLVALKLNATILEEESGIPVTMGNTDFAKGHTESYQFTEVSSMKSDVPNIQNAPQTQPHPQVDEPLITQPDEPTVDMPTAEEIEAQKRAEAERQAAERATQQMASAFGKGFEMGSKGEATDEPTQEGTQGIETGVSAADKLVAKEGFSPSFDLHGRSVYGGGSLPYPVNTVQAEGRIVVTITVDPSGRVIETRINLRSTNNPHPELQKAALDAAKRARFNSISGVNNQTGTITYYFKLR